MTDTALVSAYRYNLPEELIAQTPLLERDSSRLMVVRGERTEHRMFRDITEYLRPGDLLILNDTRVIPARMMGTRAGGGRAEIFLLRPGEDENTWIALAKPGRKLGPGSRVLFDVGHSLTVEERLEDGLRRVRFSGNPWEAIHAAGQVPLPPYIKNTLNDAERYQTVYANTAKEQSSAAPTAGLHFTESLLDKIRAMGVGTEYVTLDVGLGTFRPVQAEIVSDHVMHSEMCCICENTARAIRDTKAGGGRVIAVGTTVVRTLESFADSSSVVFTGVRETDIFIRPGYNFRVVDGLVTNFHLPGSTLIMLVAAMGGHQRVMAAYKTAVECGYRFFSFGDAMMLLK